jgi:hypothetical protein
MVSCRVWEIISIIIYEGGDCCRSRIMVLNHSDWRSRVRVTIQVQANLVSILDDCLGFKLRTLGAGLFFEPRFLSCTDFAI